MNDIFKRYWGGKGILILIEPQLSLMIDIGLTDGNSFSLRIDLIVPEKSTSKVGGANKSNKNLNILSFKLINHVYRLSYEVQQRII